MSKLKLMYSNIANKIYLFNKYKKYYLSYYLKNKSKIYYAMKRENISNIKPVHKEIWKLWYNTSYYIAKLGGKEVFVKVMGNLLRDCFENEVLLNNYIDCNSEWLKNRKPKLIKSIVIDDLYILVYSNIYMQDINSTDNIEIEIVRAINEYQKIGVLHTDFGLTNLANCNNKTFFIDYGTSICSESNSIRVRNDASYNHIDKISDEAREICPNADFYYNDAVHIGVDSIDYDVNFLVGKGDTYYAKLGNKIVKYKLQFNGDVYLLTKKK